MAARDILKIGLWLYLGCISRHLHRNYFC